MNTKERPLLLLGGASMPAGADCLAQAASRGVPVVLADTAENLTRLPELAGAAARVVELPYTDPDACVAYARSQPPFLGVYGFRELAVESVAATAAALGLPGNPPAAVARVRDKAACRQALRAAGFRQPATARCTEPAQATRFLKAHLPGPWVVKPPAAKGSAGVSLVRLPAELPQALAHVRAAQAELAAELAAQGMPPAPDSGAFLVEEFQQGVEYSAEGLFVRGRPVLLAVTGKQTAGPPHFVETGHALPIALDRGSLGALHGTLAGALPALGLRWGVFHVEFWMHAGRVVLGEVHVRPGGDYIHAMTQHVTGIELHGAVIDQLLGRPLDPAGWRPRGAAAVRFLTPPPGVVTAVSGWDAVRADPAFLAGELTLAPGTRVRPLRSSADRSSFVVTTGPDLTQAVDAARRLVAAVDVHVQTQAPDVQPETTHA